MFNIKQPVDNIDILQYNYPPTSLYKNQYQSKYENSQFIKTPYISKPNEPNIAIFGSGYTATNIYIVAPIHQIAGVSYDAELIIEHRALTNHSDPLYTCFLLSSTPYTHNDIDQFIEGDFDTTLELNSFIKGQKSVIFYKNNQLKAANIVVFPTPIEVGTVFKGWKDGITFMAPYTDKYSILAAKPILGEPVIEGATGSIATDAPLPDLSIPGAPELPGLSDFSEKDVQKVIISDTVENKSNSVSIAGYCQPIDETDPTIGETANVVVPINSKTISNDATGTSIKTMLNFFGFFVLVIAAVFVTPIAHKILIVELIQDNDTFSAQRKLNRANAADVYTGSVFFGFAVAFINYGIINNTPIATILGFYVFVFLMASILILQYERIMTPEKYLKNFETKGVLPNFENIEMDWGFITDNLMSLFFKKTMEPNMDPATKGKEPFVSKYNFQVGFLIVGLLYTALFFLLKRWNLTGKGGNFFLTSIYFYFLLFAIYMYALVNHYRYKSSKLNK